MDWFQRTTPDQSPSSRDQGLASCCFSCFQVFGRPVPRCSQGDLLSGGVVTVLLMAWKSRPVLCQPPEGTWHSRAADGETKAQGVTPGAVCGNGIEEGPPPDLQREPGPELTPESPPSPLASQAAVGTPGFQVSPGRWGDRGMTEPAFLPPALASAPLLPTYSCGGPVLGTW